MEDRGQQASEDDANNLKRELKSDLTAFKEEIIQPIRERETKLLRAFREFTKRSDEAALRSRIAMIETRLTDIEHRLNLPPT